MKKLKLRRETLRLLANSVLIGANGGSNYPSTGPTSCPVNTEPGHWTVLGCGGTGGGGEPNTNNSICECTM
jgi:hypothetical protein